MVSMESIESRQLLSGGGNGTLRLNDSLTLNVVAPTGAIEAHVSKTGTLHITGTDTADKITVGYATFREGNASLSHIFVKRNDEIAALITEPVKRVSIQGKGGRDIINLDLKQSVTGKLVGGKGKDVLVYHRDAVVAAGVYPYKTDPDTIPVKGLITAYPIAEPSDAEKKVTDPSGGVNMFTHAGGTNPVIQSNSRDSESFTTGVQRAWAGKLTPSRPAQLENHGVYDASLINDLLFYGEDALTPSERPTSIVVTQSDGSATAYLYDPKTDKVTVGIEENFKIHFIDSKGNEVREAIKGQGYLWKMAVPDEA